MISGHGRFARRGAVALRGLRGDSVDLGCMLRWLSDDRVLEWYGGREPRDDPEEIEDFYAAYRRVADPVQPCIIELSDRPIGYLQLFSIAQVDDGGLYELDDRRGHFGLDLFIGEPDLWGCGYGTAALRAAVDHLASLPDALRAVVDPRLCNARAIAAYEKVGFRREKLLRVHELHEGVWRDCWRMALGLGSWRRGEDWTWSCGS